MIRRIVEGFVLRLSALMCIALLLRLCFIFDPHNFVIASCVLDSAINTTWRILHLQERMMHSMSPFVARM